MTNEQLRASILLLCGLPGSGKSTLAAKLHSEFSRQNGSKCTSFDKVVVIDYDKIANEVNLSMPGGGLDLSDPNEATNNCKEQTINCKYTLFDSNDLEAWRKSRISALIQLKEALHSHFSTDTRYDDTKPKTLLILMDDNFHLKSMRRDVYRACQRVVTEFTATIGFVTLYVSTAVQICIEQNEKRQGKKRVPEEVIRQMNVAMEPPNPSRAYGSFEKFHLTFNYGDNIDDERIEQIDHCLKEALVSQIPPRLTDEETDAIEAEKIQQRQETLKCQLQRCDQLLRKLVGAVGKVDKSKSKAANEARKKILEDCKSVSNLGDDFLFNSFIQMLGFVSNSRRDDTDNPLVCSILQTFDEFVTSRAS